MQAYPYSNPIILTDQIFSSYGGQTGTSSIAQRQASYLLAEEQVTEDLSAFLLPTIITGSVVWRSFFAETEFGHVHRVLLASVSNVTSTVPLTTETITGSVLIRDAQHGYLDLFFPNCDPRYGTTTVVYESGLRSGTSFSPSVLTALVIAAQINLNEMDVSLSNESTADIGVQRYGNQSYTEERVKLGRTTFGSSALAQRAARLLRKYRVKPGTVLR